jgi:N-acetylglucosaminyldiphosphoundecaprenol N-acetyl-beta-D-mannosaminyltransferase
MDENIAQRIRQANPDILLVAFGNPKQEKWINMHARTLAVPVMIGVGGTLDFIAGVTKRAPAWMQKTGLEWVFRLAQEPRRLWKRYVVDFGGFGIFFVRQWLLMRGKSMPATIVPQNDIVLVEGQLVVNLGGRLDGGNAESFHRKIIQAINDLGRTPRLIINLANAQFIDSRGLGVLVAIAKMTRDGGSDMCLAATPNAIANTLKLMRVDTFFQQFKDVPSALAGEDKTSSSMSVPNTSTWGIITMPRRLDAATSPQVSDACEIQIKKNPRLVLDLATTVFLSSAGLGMLVKLDKLAQSMGGEVRLANCSHDIVRSLQLGRMEMVVKWFPSLEAAMR